MNNFSQSLILISDSSWAGFDCIFEDVKEKVQAKLIQLVDIGERVEGEEEGAAALGQWLINGGDAANLGHDVVGLGGLFANFFSLFLQRFKRSNDRIIVQNSSLFSCSETIVQKILNRRAG